MKPLSFISTRGQTAPLTFTQAVAMGLAPDGGLLLPEDLPDLSSRLSAWASLGYAELAEAFFREFALDLPGDTLRELVQRSYAGFTHPEVAPLIGLRDNLHVLELFHGPTLAFKDFALQLLGNLYEDQIRRTQQPLNVLGATSGDTGAAAIHGLLGRDGVKVFMLYPEGGVSPLQERQMTCTGSPYVYAMAVTGTFDDAQRVIKDIFGDLEFRRERHLSAVNSINLARVLAQCVYYFYAWFRLPESARRRVEFVVPTGNFGNVLAGWMAQKMGLPIHRFRVATNRNDILYRLFREGIYQVRDVEASYAPSMDIQVASNFERFLYFHEGRDPERVREVMSTFKRTGQYRFTKFDPDTFTASRTTDEEISRIIQRVYQEFGYVVDPHTACGFQDLDPEVTSVVLATAHPAKFPQVLESAVGFTPTHPSLEALRGRPIVKYILHPDVADIRRFVADRT